MSETTCNLCNKEFTTPSKLERHKLNKIPCNKKKEELKCIHCNIKFTRPSEKIRHEKTNKHMKNY